MVTVQPPLSILWRRCYLGKWAIREELFFSLLGPCGPFYHSLAHALSVSFTCDRPEASLCTKLMVNPHTKTNECENMYSQKTVSKIEICESFQ